MVKSPAPIDCYIGRTAGELPGSRQGGTSILLAERKKLFEYGTVLADIVIGRVNGKDT